MSKVHHLNSHIEKFRENKKVTKIFTECFHNKD